MGFPKQEYWSGLQFPSQGDLSEPGIEPTSPVSPALAGGFFTRVTWEALFFFFFAILTIKKNKCSKNPVVKITGLTKIKRDRPFKTDANLYPEN